MPTDVWHAQPSARALHLRFHALYLLEELAPFSPRLVGDLTEPEEEMLFFEGIELDVAPGGLDAASRHLASMGYRIEPVVRGARRGFEAELLERIVVWARDDALRGLTHDELELLLDVVYGPDYRDTLRVRRY